MIRWSGGNHSSFWLRIRHDVIPYPSDISYRAHIPPTFLVFFLRLLLPPEKEKFPLIALSFLLFNRLLKQYRTLLYFKFTEKTLH